MIKLSSNFITLVCCLGQKDVEMEQALDMGVPFIDDVLGNSPLHYAQLKCDHITVDKLV